VVSGAVVVSVEISDAVVSPAAVLSQEVKTDRKTQRTSNSAENDFIRDMGIPPIKL